MPGTGTLINTAAVIAGGIAGHFTGRFFKDQQQDAICRVCGISVLFIAIAGAMEGMLQVTMAGDGRTASLSGGRSMFIVLCLAIGTVIGELLRIEDGWMLDCLVEGSADSAAWVKFCMRRGDETTDVEYVLDGTPESAWERVLMDFAESQFFLVWHAGAAGKCIVTSAKRFKYEATTLEGGAKAWNTFSPLTRLRLRRKDLKPSVSVEGEVATVSFCMFSSFQGLIRSCCKVDLKTGEIKSEDFEILALYHCGVIF